MRYSLAFEVNKIRINSNKIGFGAGKVMNGTDSSLRAYCVGFEVSNRKLVQKKFTFSQGWPSFLTYTTTSDSPPIICCKSKHSLRRANHVLPLLPPAYSDTNMLP